ncbi:uncharacterized protein LAJ45_03535 [Morchella importuna]|uniref:uncharacterized protein n=1 Tax=Morchella importuna TaxID=1174673 RepID=UPI001E8DE675|nr:uncharacterized protein LAJ45_03535 [Morchella importuna]KAH8152693.1 hypothetical protein LAJ45_03535 [Morchella importuna]
MANGEGEQPEKKMILRGRTPEEDGDGEEEEEEQVQEEEEEEEEQLSTSSTSSTPPPALSMNGVEYLQTGLQLPTPLAFSGSLQIYTTPLIHSLSDVSPGSIEDMLIDPRFCD